MWKDGIVIFQNGQSVAFIEEIVNVNKDKQMAFDDTTRKLLQNFVSSVRSILTDDFTRQFQNEYGIDPQINWGSEQYIGFTPA